MHYSDIVFRFNDTQFQHNVGVELALFAIWNDAAPYLSKIRERLAHDFEILCETQIVWSEKHFTSNAARLYQDLYLQKDEANSAVQHRKKIGNNEFTVFVVKDSSPEYTYARSVSGKIEFSNMRVVNVKYELREYVQSRIGVPYAIHSTNGIHEFFSQTPLIFGVDTFLDFLEGRKFQEKRLEKDLEGAGGWESYQELFQLLNYTTDYLVLRGFEALPDENPEADLDVLTDTHQQFASVVGATQDGIMPFKGTIYIQEKPISLDIRFVGDKYYDPAWALKMLQTKSFANGFYVPRTDHYFFSLLFHAKVQKPRVKDKYYGILETIAEELDFKWFDIEKLDDDKAMGEILRGYFHAEGFVYEDPADSGVYRNGFVIGELPRFLTYSRQKAFITRVKEQVHAALPEAVIPIVKRILRR